MTAYAPPGTKIAGHEIGERVFSGITSYGMLCSPLDLGLTGDGNKLCELPENTEVGIALQKVVPLADSVFEVDNKSLSNRPDLWGHIGMARELAALLRRLKVPAGVHVTGAGREPEIVVEASDTCPRYTSFRFSVPAVSPSPLWLQTFLHRLQYRPVSNVVDLTNFVMLEWGNPMHAFDAQYIASGKLIVRYAREGETVETLDGVSRNLTPEDLLICDAEKPVGLAGIMGLANSEIRDDTTECLLEVANFRADVIRRSAIRLKLRTEASARFEKALDPDMPPVVCRRFAELLRDVVPGSTVLSGIRDLYTGRPSIPVIEISGSYINQRLGTDLSIDFIVDALRRLQFTVTHAGSDTLQVQVPGFRATRDISIPEDLVEEVGRVFGYDKIVPAQPCAMLPKPYRDPTIVFQRMVRAALSLTSRLPEVQNYSFDPEPLLARIGAADTERVGLRNPIGADATHLRSHLLPGLLAVVCRNLGIAEKMGFYEIGRVFRPVPHALPNQPYHLGILLWARSDCASAEAQRAATNQLKSVVSLLSSRLDVPLKLAKAKVMQPWLHPVRQAAIQLPDGTVIGNLGALHPRVCNALELGYFAAAAEIELDTLQAAPQKAGVYKPIVRFPTVPIDISLVVPYCVTHETLLATIQSAAIPALAQIDYVDTFTGSPIPEGSKSMTYRLVFQSDERTLSKNEVALWVEQIVRLCAERSGASLRE